MNGATKSTVRNFSNVRYEYRGSVEYIHLTSIGWRVDYSRSFGRTACLVPPVALPPASVRKMLAASVSR